MQSQQLQKYCPLYSTNVWQLTVRDHSQMNSKSSRYRQRQNDNDDGNMYVLKNSLSFKTENGEGVRRRKHHIVHQPSKHEHAAGMPQRVVISPFSFPASCTACTYQGCCCPMMYGNNNNMPLPPCPMICSSMSVLSHDNHQMYLIQQQQQTQTLLSSSSMRRRPSRNLQQQQQQEKVDNNVRGMKSSNWKQRV